MSMRIKETQDGFDLSDDGKYIASFRSLGAAQAGKHVEARRKMKRLMRESHERGALACGDRQ